MCTPIIWLLLAVLCVIAVSIPSHEHIANGMRRHKKISQQRQHLPAHFNNRNARRARGARHGVATHHGEGDDTLAGLFEHAPTAYLNTRYLHHNIKPLAHSSNVYVHYEQRDIQNPSSIQNIEEERLHPFFPDDSLDHNANTAIALDAEHSAHDFHDVHSERIDHNDFDITGQSTETEQMDLKNDDSYDEQYHSEYDALSDDDEEDEHDGYTMVQGQAILLEDIASVPNSHIEERQAWTEDELHEPLEEGSFDSAALPNTHTATFRVAETPDDVDVSESFQTAKRHFAQLSDSEAFTETRHDMDDGVQLERMASYHVQHGYPTDEYYSLSPGSGSGTDNDEAFTETRDDMDDGVEMEGMASHHVQDGYPTEEYYNLSPGSGSRTDDDDNSYETSRTNQEDDTHVNGQSMIHDSPTIASDEQAYTGEEDNLHRENRNHIDFEDDDEEDEADLQLAQDHTEAYLLDSDDELTSDMESMRFELDEYDADFEDADNLSEGSSIDYGESPSIGTARSMNAQHEPDSADHTYADDGSDASEWTEGLDESVHDEMADDIRTASSEYPYSPDGEYELNDGHLPDASRNGRVDGFAIFSDGEVDDHTSSSSYRSSEDTRNLEQDFYDNDQGHTQLDDDVYIHSSARDTSNLVEDRNAQSSDDEYIFDETEEWDEQHGPQFADERFSQSSLHHHGGGGMAIHDDGRILDMMKKRVEHQYPDVSENYDNEEDFSSGLGAHAREYFGDASTVMAM